MITCFFLSFFIGNYCPYSPDGVKAGFVILPLIIVALVVGCIITVLIKCKRAKERENALLAGENAGFGCINNRDA